MSQESELLNKFVEFIKMLYGNKYLCDCNHCKKATELLKEYELYDKNTRNKSV